MEIERKWLIRQEDIPYDLSSLPFKDLEQAYLSYSPTIRIRSINQGAQRILTIKAPTAEGGIAAEESELELDQKTYDFLFAHHTDHIVAKRRYYHALPSGLMEEIDIFFGELSGLAYLEIEFPDLSSARNYPSPGWVLADVTEDLRFKNSSLARFGVPDLQF